MNIKYFYISFVFIIISCCQLYGQLLPEMNICGYEKLQKIQMDEDPTNRLLYNQIEEKYQRKIWKDKSSLRMIEIVLPVVVHIIHDNGPENISDAQVLQGLADLNAAFANMGTYHIATGVESQIQFCLAKRDPEGNLTNGIIRTTSPFTDMSEPNSFNELRDIAFWNPNNYINIQIVKDVCLGLDCANIVGLGGYQRLLIEFSKFGLSQDDSKVIVHEMGHLMGLDHTFKGGCKNDDCLTDGDKVCDTPPDNMHFDGCLSPSNSCLTDEDDDSLNNPFRSRHQYNHRFIIISYFDICNK